MQLNKLSKRGDIVFRRIGDEMVLYNPEAKFVHMINATAALIWELCDGTHSLDQIEEVIRSQFELDVKDDICNDIREIAEEFEKLGLLKKDKKENAKIK